MKEELKLDFEVDEDVLRRTVMFAARQRFSIAQWSWETPSEIYKRKKDVVHALRYLLFAHQILVHGKVRVSVLASYSCISHVMMLLSSQIVDYSAANVYYHRIMSEPNEKSQVDLDFYRLEKERISKEFKVLYLAEIHACNAYVISIQATKILKYFHTRCETIIHNLNHTISHRENFDDYFSYPKLSSPADERGLGVESGLSTIAFLRIHGLNQLVRQYKIAVTRHPAFPGLVHLYADVRFRLA